MPVKTAFVPVRLRIAMLSSHGWIVRERKIRPLKLITSIFNQNILNKRLDNWSGKEIFLYIIIGLLNYWVVINQKRRELTRESVWVWWKLEGWLDAAGFSCNELSVGNGGSVKKYINLVSKNMLKTNYFKVITTNYILLKCEPTPNVGYSIRLLSWECRPSSPASQQSHQAVLWTYV